MEVTFYEVHVTSSADIGEGSTEERSVEDEACPLARLDPLYFTITSDENACSKSIQFF